MASELTTFEIMIHRLAADADAASLLQRRLQQNGIRAGVTDLTATTTHGGAKSARRSLCFLGEAFREQNLTGNPHDSFDFVFAGSGAEPGLQSDKTWSPEGFRRLVAHLSQSSEGPMLSAQELRRATRASYDTIAAQFTDVWFDAVPGEALETFLKHLPRHASILDAGCGPGHHAGYFKKAGFDPIGLDFSSGMLDIAAQKNPNISFIHADILSPALPKASFDGVWSGVTLNHIPTEEASCAIANLVGTLKWGGYIGLNFQIGRPSEIVSRGGDHRFFEYPADEKGILIALKALGVHIVSTHFGTTTRNVHSLNLEMRFATVVGRNGQPA